jgi:hypothetical protein
MTARPPRASERKVLMRRAAVVESKPEAASRNTETRTVSGERRNHALLLLLLRSLVCAQLTRFVRHDERRVSEHLVCDAGSLSLSSGDSSGPRSSDGRSSALGESEQLDDAVDALQLLLSCELLRQVEQRRVFQRLLDGEIGEQQILITLIELFLLLFLLLDRVREEQFASLVG